MLILTTTFFIVEIVVGHLTNSMALIADSFHMLSDIAALIIAFVSIKMAPKEWKKSTYGWARAEVLGALVNAVFLMALCFSITMESFKRFYESEEIHNPDMILVVGSMGLGVNILGLCLFHEHGGSGHSHGDTYHNATYSRTSSVANKIGEESKTLDQSSITSITIPHEIHSEGKPCSNTNSKSGRNLNIRGVFLHVMADALGSVIVIISALIMWKLPEWKFTSYVDALLSLIMVMLIMCSAWPLLKEAALILLQTVPTHIDIELLKRKLIKNVDGILAVHEFHVWQLSGNRIIASAHIKCRNLSEYRTISESVKEILHKEGIHSTTIQQEFADFTVQHNQGIVEEKDECNKYHMKTLNKDDVNEDQCSLDFPEHQKPNTSICKQSKCGTSLQKNNKHGSSFGIRRIFDRTGKSTKITPKELKRIYEQLCIEHRRHGRREQTTTN